MAGVRCTEVQSRPTEFLDLTSVTLEEFQQQVPPFEAAFQAHMAAWRLDGKPRTARRFPVYKTCPLPTPEEWLFFLLTYLKTYALQVVQGKANQRCPFLLDHNMHEHGTQNRERQRHLVRAIDPWPHLRYNPLG
jgi:hypothetical protein